jgi:hypothetical protein
MRAGHQCYWISMTLLRPKRLMCVSVMRGECRDLFDSLLVPTINKQVQQAPANRHRRSPQAVCYAPLQSNRLPLEACDQPGQVTVLALPVRARTGCT